MDKSKTIEKLKKMENKETHETRKMKSGERKLKKIET